MISTERSIIENDEVMLIANAAAGDSLAFTSLVNRYDPALRHVVNSICCDKTEREDMMQEGLIGLLKAVRTYDNSSSSFSTYAFLCIRNSVISAKRKYNREFHTTGFEDTLEKLDSMPETLRERSPEDVLLDKEMTSMLYDGVMSLLSTYEKNVFEMYLDGEKNQQIALKLNKDAKSVGNAVTRIKKKLTAALNRYIASKR
ncbi:MAG TPA: sigma-70 family RNA polymerase sigma factor [Bacillota bacterium]|nr:sigma-70 family RNA polymerase sigma factor [Bacillota bacterium]